MTDINIPDGWPCALLSATPPSVADRLSNPSADDLLPQVLALTPRGAAWGTDEAGDGQGASPVQRGVWRALAAWVADLSAREWTVATQAFPSAATISLADWEKELGLPDRGTPAGQTDAQRVMAVRSRFGALGGTSPAYFVCLASSLGYEITIEEPTSFLIDTSELVAGGETETWFTPGPDGSDVGQDGDPLAGFILGTTVDDGDAVAGVLTETGFVLGIDGSELGADGDPIDGYSAADPANDLWGDWIVHVPDPTISAFTATGGGAIAEAGFMCGGDGSTIGDDGDALESFIVSVSTEAGSTIGPDGDPLEGYTPALALECAISRAGQPHTRLHFSYDLPV